MSLAAHFAREISTSERNLSRLLSACTDLSMTMLTAFDRFVVGDI